MSNNLPFPTPGGGQYTKTTETDGVHVPHVIIEGGVTVDPPVGGALESKQDAQIAAEQAIQASIGAKDDSAASSDTGTFSLIALVKRGLSRLTTFWGSAGDSPPSLAANASGQLGWQRKISDLLAGNLSTSSVAASVTSTTLQNAVSATGNGSLLDVSGYAVAVLQVSGAFSATISFEASVDDSNWFSINATKLGSDSLVTSTTSTGLYRLSVSGLKSIRARVTWTSGTLVTVTGRATFADSHAKIVTPVPRAMTATLSSVAASASNVTLLAASSRVYATIVNDSTTATLKIKMGATASSTSYSEIVPPGGTWYPPPGLIYQGQIDGIWSSADGNARITEYT